MDIDQRLKAAYSDYRRQRYDEALAGFTEVLDAAPDDPCVRGASADCLFQLGRLDESILASGTAIDVGRTGASDCHRIVFAALSPEASQNRMMAWLFLLRGTAHYFNWRKTGRQSELSDAHSDFLSSFDLEQPDEGPYMNISQCRWAL